MHQLTLDEYRAMVRHNDHDTSIQAAESVGPHLNALHSLILAYFKEARQLDDETLEQNNAFKMYGPSTIRKRRSELYQWGYLKDSGNRVTNSRGRKMIVWSLNESYHQ